MSPWLLALAPLAAIITAATWRDRGGPTHIARSAAKALRKFEKTAARLRALARKK